MRLFFFPLFHSVYFCRQDEVSGLKSWMAEVDTFLSAEEVALGDMEVLQAQLEQGQVMFPAIDRQTWGFNAVEHLIKQTNIA